MSPERWQEVQRLFCAALEVEAGERRGLVAERAGDDAELLDEVLSLLGAHGEAAEETFLAAGGAGATVGWTDLPATLPQLEKYHWLGPLGAGGMGSVYLAVRADQVYQQRVAIKLVRLDLDGPAVVRRFERERQILAELDHPNIARLLDGGEAPDGRPYLVMEHIEGVPIDVFCRRYGLDIRARLRLMIKVCDAVHAAHQRLVVHRDLKPGNILVTDAGEPKLLDFGIAKPLGPEHVDGLGATAMTAPGQAPMTREYASPEQVQGLSVTTASDIYSLGVLLYELLAGRRPLVVSHLPTDRALRRLVEEIPQLPSSSIVELEDPESGVEFGEPGSRGRLQWSRSLRGDLDSIVATALAKEPERRYGSAEALAQDLTRHLDGLPVLARGDSALYLAGRFVRRHRLPVTIALIAFIGQAVLILGLVLQRAETLRERDRATAVTETLVEIFENADPGRSRGDDLPAREVLDSGRDRIAGLADQPELQADLEVTMGRVYTSLGLSPLASELLESALETRRSLHRGDHPEVAEAMELWAQALHDADRPAEATGLLEDAVSMRRRLHGANAPEVAAALDQLASAVHRGNDFERARRHYEEALGIRRLAGEARPLAAVLNSLGTLERDLGRLDAAVDLHRESVSLLRGLADPGVHPELAWSLTNLGVALRRRADFSDAEASYLEAEALQRRLYPQPHPLLAYTLDQIGLLRLRQERLEDAEAYFAEALAMRTAVFGAEDARVAEARANLAKVAFERGDLERAEAEFAAVLDTLRAVLPPGHIDLATAMNHRAELLVRRGDLAAAEALFEEVLEIQRGHFGDRHPSVAVVLNNLARCVAARQDHRRAIELRRDAVSIMRGELGDQHPDLAAMLFNLAVSHHHAGERGRARELYGEALGIAEPSLGDDHSLVIALRQVLGRLADDVASP
ncbi:MAG: tetratricopeptide repeat protein [Acidobacteriota bacterium]